MLDPNIHAAVIRLAVAYTLLGVFIVTAVVTVLALLGKFKFPSKRLENRLYQVLIVEVVAICVGIFGDFLRFSPARAVDEAQVDAQTSPPRIEPVTPLPNSVGVVQPEAQVLSARLPVSLIGGWKRVGGGDPDMHTTGDDKVQVQIRSTIHVRDSRFVDIKVFFRCEEDGGDHTTYQGERTATVYKAPEGKRITAIEPPEGTGASFTTTTRGQAHNFYPVKVDGTHWARLSFRVDGRGKDDNKRVGVTGDLNIKISLQDAR
jgi:hypothetical protein